jgi:ParB family chromosome partitioning protein
VAERGMGRGLAAILSVAEPAGPAADELRELPLAAISPNPDQPRRRFDDEALQALAGSLAERGILQPVLVRAASAAGRYELIAGERRWRAAQIAGLEHIPAIVRESDDAASLELALIENVAREDLNPVEEARAMAALVEELGLTREAVGKRVGRGRVAVSNLIRLLDLPDEALELLETGDLSEGHGRALLLVKDHAERVRLGRAAASGGWPVRKLEAQARAAAAAPPGGRASREPHPDQSAAMERIADTLGAALGRDVAVRHTAKGYRATIELESAAEADALARRLGGPGG